MQLLPESLKSKQLSKQPRRPIYVSLLFGLLLLSILVTLGNCIQEKKNTTKEDISALKKNFIELRYLSATAPELVRLKEFSDWRLFEATCMKLRLECDTALSLLSKDASKFFEVIMKEKLKEASEKPRSENKDAKKQVDKEIEL